MPNFKVNKPSINVEGFASDMQEYLMGALHDVEDELLDQMRRELDNWTAGKPEWLDEMHNALTVVEREVTSEYVASKIGIPFKENSMAYIRAMVVTYGAGSGAAVGNQEPIHTKPGESVFNANLTGKKKSKATEVYNLPARFNQVGNNFVENAVRNVYAILFDILDKAVSNMPGSILEKNLVWR